MFAFPFEAVPGISSNTKDPHRAFCGELCAGADATICPCGFVLVCHFSFLRPVAAKLPPEGGIGVSGFCPCERRKCTFARCLHGLSPSPEGLFFSCTAFEFSFRKFSRYADCFCGFQQKRSASAFSVHTPHCYHFGVIRYQFFGKDRLSGQIAIRSLGRQTGYGKKIAIQPVYYHFRRKQYQNRAK